MKISRWLLASCLMSSSWGYANLAEQPSIQKKIDHLSTRLVAYTAKDSMSRYQAYKAKMWLSYAQNELSETSLTTAGQEALQNAQILVDGLVQGQPLSLTTPILSVSQVMRRDLWQQVEYLKQQGALATAPENLAHAEVMLVWAAAEYCELGWRHANEHFKAVERELYQAVDISGIKIENKLVDLSLLPSLTQLNGEGCQGVNVEFWPMDKTSKSSVIKVQNVVHFALNSEQLSPISQRVLDQFISILKQYPLIDMTLLGYTDSRASSAYNLNLAQRRIQAVQNYLTQSGIEASRIQSEAKGKKDLESDTNIYMQHAKSRRVVLELNDEVVHIQTEPQWQDLQLEKVLKENEGEPK